MDKIFGLYNKGNTCYQNAAIQSLCCIDKFVKKVMNLEFIKNIIEYYKITTNNINDEILTYEILKILFDNIHLKKVDPSDIPNCIRRYKILYNNKITMPFKIEFPSYEQLDSYDFLNAILTILNKELNISFMYDLDENLENIEKEYNELNNKVIDYNLDNVRKYSALQINKIYKDGFSLINNIFSGQYINISECENCGFKNFSFTFSDTLDLDLFCKEKLTIFSNLYECLDNQMNLNLYSDGNIHKKQTGHLRCFNYFKFFLPPNVLIIRLKRFTDKSKINNPIDIPLNLNISKYIHMYSEKNNNCNYKLSSAIIHMGSLGGGHYISVGNKCDMWLEFNDTNVSKLNDLLLNHYLQQSYILFYQQV